MPTETQVLTNEVLVCKDPTHTGEHGTEHELIARLLAGPGRDAKKVYEAYLAANGLSPRQYGYFTFNIARHKNVVPIYVFNPNNLPPATR